MVVLDREALWTGGIAYINNLPTTSLNGWCTTNSVLFFHLIYVRYGLPVIMQCRRIISLVHPDRFEGFPKEQNANTESLKVLHKFIESLHTNCTPKQAVGLEFYARDDDKPGDFKHVALHIKDSLLPLYEHFSVIDKDEAARLRSKEAASASGQDVNFLDWLKATIQVSERARTRPP
jgi:hypothetical protein